jgi:hypothetical protein
MDLLPRKSVWLRIVSTTLQGRETSGHSGTVSVNEPWSPDPSAVSRSGSTTTTTSLGLVASPGPESGSSDVREILGDAVRGRMFR